MDLAVRRARYRSQNVLDRSVIGPSSKRYPGSARTFGANSEYIVTRPAGGHLRVGLRGKYYWRA